MMVPCGATLASICPPLPVHPAPPGRSPATRPQDSAPHHGQGFHGACGKRYRPSTFITLTCDSYGQVGDDGTPSDPGSYDYAQAARDAIHFAALVDRFIQNLRRVLGYEAQYFGGVEPQKRLALHIGTKSPQHHLLVRRSLHPGEKGALELAYFRCWSPRPVTLAELVAVAGAQWGVEDCFAEAKGEAGLDHYQVRKYQAWYRHVTLSMLAHAFLAVTARDSRQSAPPPPASAPASASGHETPAKKGDLTPVGRVFTPPRTYAPPAFITDHAGRDLIPLTAAESRRQFNLHVTVTRPRGFHQRWSDWRRYRQAAARKSHYACRTRSGSSRSRRIAAAAKAEREQ